MPRVDFYILDSDQPSSRLEFCAKLCLKAMSHQVTAAIVVESRQQATELDDFLWAFPPDAYLPHALWPCDTPRPPVTIHVAADTGSSTSSSQAPSREFEGLQLLINLCTKLPPHAETFERVAEIVNQEHNVLSTSRERYKHYQAQNMAIQTHKIGAQA